jgi:hypothetical protein
MINRRKLFGFIAAAPATAASAVVANANKDLEPDSNILTLQRSDIVNTTPYVSEDGQQYFTGTYRQSGPKLHISVGKDGHMWLKINEKWKRVVSE